MTIDDMARELGVSKRTISRALSGKGRIGEETRLKICNYAQEHDFIPKKSSRNHKVLTKNLGVVIPADAYSTSIPFFQDCLLGVCEAATQNDYNVLIATRTAFDFSGIQNLVENKRIDGIILTRSLEDDKAIKYLT